MKSTTNLKLLPLVTALCVLVLTAVGCRHNVVLQELLRNRNKRTAQETVFPDAYYVKSGGTGDGTAYSTPFGTLKQALDAARSSGGKTDRVIVIGPLTDADSGFMGGGGASAFFLEGYGTAENSIIIGGMSGGGFEGGTEKRVMYINNSCLRFENVTFTKGETLDNSGGGLYITGNSNVTLKNGTRIIKNKVAVSIGEKQGGGIYIDSGELTIDGAEITNNTLSGNDSDGGGLCVAGGKVTFNSGTITANTARYGSGGGILVNGGEFTMNGGTVSANNAVYGGGLSVSYAAVVTINAGQFNVNTAISQGGGIWNAGTLTINGGTIQNNTVGPGHNNLKPSGFGGGGIYNTYKTLIINGGVIQNNETAIGNGGGIHINSGSVTINGGIIQGNKAMSSGNTVGKETVQAQVTNNYSTGNGGGIYIGYTWGVANTPTMLIKGGTIQNNTANGNYDDKNGGGGIYSTANAAWTLDGGEIKNNTVQSANGRGGGVYVYSGTMTYTSGKITGNTADTGNGKSIYSNGTVTPPLGSNPYEDSNMER